MYTNEQLRRTVETLKILKAENPDRETDKYTADEIIDQLLLYFEYCWEVANTPLNEDYERAMQVVGK